MVKDLAENVQIAQVKPVAMPNAQTIGERTASNIGKLGTITAGIIQKHQKDVLEAERASLHVQIINNIRRIHEQLVEPGKFNEHAVDSFDAQVKGMSEGILATVDPKNRAWAQNIIQYYAEQNRSGLVSKVQNLGRNRLIANTDESFYKIAEQAKIAAYKGEMTLDKNKNQVMKSDILVSQANRALDLKLNLGMSGQTVAAQKARFHDEVEKEIYLGQYHRALVGGDPEKYLKQFNKNKSLDPQLKESLKVHFTKMTHDYAMQIGFDRSTAHTEMKNAIAQVYDGKSQDDLQVIKNKINEFYPEAAPEFQRELDRATYAHSLVSTTKWVPPNEAVNILMEHKPKEGDPDFAGKLAEWQKIATMTQNNYKKGLADPKAYLDTNPNIMKVRNLRLVAASDGFAKIPSQSNPSTIDLPGAYLQEEKRMGLPQSLVGTQEGAAFVRSISNLTNEQKLQRLNGFIIDHAAELKFENGNYKTEINKEYANIVFKDLAKSKLPISDAILMSMQHNPKSLPLLNSAMNAFESSEKDLRAALPTGFKFDDFSKLVDKNLNSYINSMHGYNGDVISSINEIKGATRKLGMYLFISGKAKGLDEAAKQAAGAVVNDNFNYYTYNANTIRTPQDIDHRSAIDASNVLKVKALNDPELNVPTVFQLSVDQTPEQKRTDYYRSILSHGYTQTLPDHTGLQLLSSQGIPVKKTDGTPYIAKFQDIRNPGSDLRSDIANLPVLALEAKNNKMLAPIRDLLPTMPKTLEQLTTLGADLVVRAATENKTKLLKEFGKSGIQLVSRLLKAGDE